MKQFLLPIVVIASVSCGVKKTTVTEALGGRKGDDDKPRIAPVDGAKVQVALEELELEMCAMPTLEKGIPEVAPAERPSKELSLAPENAHDSAYCTRQPTPAKPFAIGASFTVAVKSANGETLKVANPVQVTASRKDPKEGANWVFVTVDGLKDGVYLITLEGEKKKFFAPLRIPQKISEQQNMLTTANYYAVAREGEKLDTAFSVEYPSLFPGCSEAREKHTTLNREFEEKYKAFYSNSNDLNKCETKSDCIEVPNSCGAVTSKNFAEAQKELFEFKRDERKKVGEELVKACGNTNASVRADDSMVEENRVACPAIERRFDCVQNRCIDVTHRVEPLDCSEYRKGEEKVREQRRAIARAFFASVESENNCSSDDECTLVINESLPSVCDVRDKSSLAVALKDRFTKEVTERSAGLKNDAENSACRSQPEARCLAMPAEKVARCRSNKCVAAPIYEPTPVKIETVAPLKP